MAIKKIGDFDLIFCGRQASDWDAGQVGSGIAAILGIPIVTLARKVEVIGNKVRVERVILDGYEVVQVPLPALVTVSNELGEARLPPSMGLWLPDKRYLLFGNRRI
jgi:electron transfer flavoprotein beta subunit